jgi:hypothetical protein
MATPITTPGSNRDNCPKISTACVIWQGPDIPCINLCAGDSIDEVVFKLATLLCDVTENILDVTTLEFACLVQTGQAEPTTLLGTLQLIINKLCSVILDPTLVVGGTGRPGEVISSDPLVDLPSCLYFIQDGDTVTSLPVTEYAAYLASVICRILIDITSINVTVNNLNSRIIPLEQQVASLSSYVYQIYVTSQCASSPTAGTSLLIQDAFSNLESAYCNLVGATGISTLLVAAVNKQCPSLNTALQLNNPANTMSSLSGWISSPTTVSDSLTNLWLTMCDMRYKFASYLATPTPTPCILAVAENFIVTSITSSYTTVTWTAPSYAGIQAPTGYRMEVFQSTGAAPGGVPVGSSIYDAMITGSFLSKNIPSSTLSIGLFYIVKLYAVYTCGESNAVSVTSHLVAPVISFKVKVTETTIATTTVPCVESGSPVNYTETNKRTTVTLTNATSGVVVTNATGSPMNIVVRYLVNSCAFSGPVYDNVTIPIANGSNNGVYDYHSNTYTNCGTPLCSAVTKAISCGVTTNYTYSEFDTTTITVCV